MNNNISEILQNFELTEEKYKEAKEVSSYIAKAFAAMEITRETAQLNFLAAFLIEYGRQSERKAESKNENSPVL